MNEDVATFWAMMPILLRKRSVGVLKNHLELQMDPKSVNAPVIADCMIREKHLVIFGSSHYI